MLRSLFQKPAFVQFVKFSIVGCLNVAISTIVYYFCYTKWQLDNAVLSFCSNSDSALLINRVCITNLKATLSSIIAYLAGMLNSFIFNKLWTFKVRSGTLSQARRFFVLNMIGLALTTSIIFIFVDLLSGPYMMIWFVTVFLVMVLNFLGNKYWTFTEKTP